MYSRTPHKKSRNGCGQCKRRHTKCDFKPPVCANCKRRGEDCDYKSLPPSDPLSSEILVTPMILSTSRYFLTGKMPTSTLVDVSLANLYSLFESEGVILDAEFTQDIAQGRHPFIEHNILATTALYSRAHSPRHNIEAAPAAAYTHHIEASRLFRRSVKRVTEGNWIAIIVFAISTIVFYFNAHQEQSFSSVMDIMSVLRNTALLGPAITPLWHRSRLRSLIKAQNPGLPAKPLFELAITAMDSLEALNNTSGGDDLDKEIRRHTIGTLQDWIIKTEAWPHAWVDFMAWPATVTDEYIVLLERKDPWSLIIFVHWCAVMTNAPKRWFLEGWALRMASVVLQELEPEWETHLVWPKALFRENTPTSPIPGSSSAHVTANTKDQGAV